MIKCEKEDDDDTNRTSETSGPSGPSGPVQPPSLTSRQQWDVFLQLTGNKPDITNTPRSELRSTSENVLTQNDCEFIHWGCVRNHSLLPTQWLRHFVALSKCLVGNIIPYIVTQSIPQCIAKSSVQPMVTHQAIFTIMHCAADEHMEVSIQVSTARQ